MSVAKVLGLIGGAYAVNEMTKSGGNRSANVDSSSVNGDVLDLLIQRIKTDTHLQNLLRGPAGSGVSGKAKIEKAAVQSWLGLATGGSGLEFGGQFKLGFKETAGVASKGDIFFKIEPIGFTGIAWSAFSFYEMGEVYEDEDYWSTFNNQFWTAQEEESTPGPEISFKLGGVFGKNGAGAYEALPGVNLVLYLSDLTAGNGEEVGVKISIHGPGIEGFEHTITETVSTGE